MLTKGCNNKYKDQISKYVFNIDKQINNSFDLYKISNDIVNTIEIESNKNKNYIYIKIIDINDLNNIREAYLIGKELVDSNINKGESYGSNTYIRS